jgi:hypothetical protein
MNGFFLMSRVSVVRRNRIDKAKGGKKDATQLFV